MDQIRIEASAAKALDKIQQRDRFRILRANDRLAVEPQAGGVLEGELRKAR